MSYIHKTQSIRLFFYYSCVVLTFIYTNIVSCIYFTLTIKSRLVITLIPFFFRPDLEDEPAWFQFFMTNFERHYLGTRAPFDLSVPEGYIASYPAVYRALDRFIEFLTRLPDVFLVSPDKETIRNQTNELDNLNFRM